MMKIIFSALVLSQTETLSVAAVSECLQPYTIRKRNFFLK